MLANKTQEQTDRENWDHCKGIAEELEKIAQGLYIKCPECGEWVEVPDDIDEHQAARCECGAGLADADETMTIFDYLEDALDIEYRCGSSREYRSAQIMVACGGPTIYIDTGSKSVNLYWWCDRASYPLSNNAVSTIDDCMEELFNC